MIIKMPVKSKRWLYAKAYEQYKDPTEENFEIIEEEIDGSVKDNEILCEAVFLSVDPYMRISIVNNLTVGETMTGTQIARVVSSGSARFPEGSYVRGDLGWRTHTIVQESQVTSLPDIGDLPKSLFLGLFGLTGASAYLGVEDVLNPKPGETVVISSAAGAVGSAAGQLAKIKGCKVIGFCGSDEKCDWLTGDLGFDSAFNYKTTDVETALKTAAPDGVDCYFDCVGGDFACSVLRQMRTKGRVSVCGCMSTYHALPGYTQGDHPFMDILTKMLRVEGIIAWSQLDRWPQIVEELKGYVQEGKLKYHEHVTDGFENMATAYIDLFKGKNIGKAVIRV